MNEINYIEQLRTEVKSILDKAQEHEQFKDLMNKGSFLTIFDVLCSSNRKSPVLIDDLKALKAQVATLFKNHEHSVRKSSIDDLKLLFGKNNEKSWIKEIYTEDSVNEHQTLRISDLLEEVESVFPDDFKKKRVSVLLGSVELSHFNPLKNQLYLNVNQSETNLISEIFHEFGHIVEIQNPQLYMESLDFIKKSTNQETIKFNSLYRGRFCHPYIGTIYDYSSTEVISMGLQLMYLNPIAFLFRDPVHFEIIESILRKD